MSCLLCLYMLRAVVVSQQAKLITQAALCIFLSTPDSLLIFQTCWTIFLSAFNLFLAFFSFSTLGVLCIFVSPRTKSRVVCSSCSPSHASTPPSFFSCQEFQEQSHPFPNLFCWLPLCPHVLFCFYVLLYLILVEGAPKSFWGVGADRMRAKSKQALLQPEQGLEKELCVF